MRLIYKKRSKLYDIMKFEQNEIYTVDLGTEYNAGK